MISTKNLTLKFKHKVILDNLSVSLPKGSITTFIGKSGAGKTTLLKTIAQLYQDYSGDIEYQGKSLKTLSPQQRAHTVGFVFQQFNLFPHMTVIQNCMQPQVAVFGVQESVAYQKASLILGTLGLTDFKDAYPSQLSGGQQQRAAIARTLVLEPENLLFDEPSSSLDPQNTKSLAMLLKDLNKAGITIVLCSHDVSFVKDLLDRVYLLEEGKIVDSYHACVEGDLLPSRPIGQFLGQS